MTKKEQLREAIIEILIEENPGYLDDEAEATANQILEGYDFIKQAEIRIVNKEQT